MYGEDDNMYAKYNDKNWCASHWYPGKTMTEEDYYSYGGSWFEDDDDEENTDGKHI